MKLFENIRGKFRSDPRHAERERIAYTRGFNAAQNSNITASLKGEYDTLNRILRGQLAPLRARARQMALNNDHMRRFISLLSVHVVGVDGVTFQCRSKDTNGKFDEIANNRIETAWYEWAKREYASTSGTFSLVDIERFFMRSYAVDGEAIIRKVRGFPNKFGFALQPIDADLLDDTLNSVLPNGHQVRMGIELDEWNRPLNYYFKRSNDVEYGAYYTTSHDIVPAADIIHFFIKETASQVRGIPPASSSMLKLHHINGYAEAEVVAARAEASKTFFYERKETADGSFPGEKDPAGDFVQEIEPGIGEIIPDGYTLTPYNPTHPNGNFSEFNKAMLRGVASGLGVSYNTLANDLESVNYSSMRSGVQEEREQFMILQQMLIENFCIPVFEAWLEMALLKGAIALPFIKLAKFNAPQFIGRRWQWVDPLKDVETSKQEMAVGMSTLTETLASKGKDIVETFETIKRERELAKEYGIDLTPLASPNFTEAQK